MTRTPASMGRMHTVLQFSQEPGPHCATAGSLDDGVCSTHAHQLWICATTPTLIAECTSSKHCCTTQQMHLFKSVYCAASCRCGCLCHCVLWSLPGTPTHYCCIQVCCNALHHGHTGVRRVQITRCIRLEPTAAAIRVGFPRASAGGCSAGEAAVVQQCHCGVWGKTHPLACQPITCSLCTVDLPIGCSACCSLAPHQPAASLGPQLLDSSAAGSW